VSPPRRRRSSRGGQRNRTPAGRAFWGADDAPERELPVIVPTAHPEALVESLGALPFPGGRVAQHYFDAVYDRAAGLALALATAAGLTDLGGTSADDAEPADGAEPFDGADGAD
jgi:hypothetical protein